MKHARQVLIEGWDQPLIRRQSAVIVGCGAIGSALGINLARLGVGRIGLVDPDRLEEHNLENQAYDQSDLGRPKVLALRDRLLAIDATLRIEAYMGRAQETGDMPTYGWWFGCVDNVATRHWLNDAAVAHGRVLIDAGIDRFRGVVKTILPGLTACQSCYPMLVPAPPKPGCSSDPVPSTFVVASVTAGLQAAQFMNLLLGNAPTSRLHVHLGRMKLEAQNFEPNPKCDVCGDLQ